MLTRAKRTAAALAITFSAGLALAGVVQAQQKTMSIGTGGTGGVYYPLGGAVANVLSKTLPNVQATAEVTGGSIDNLKLIGSGQSEMGFTMADGALDALQGQDKFKSGKVALQALLGGYPDRMHGVTVEGGGIETMADLKGKRVSTGSPGGATEVMAFRVIEAAGLDKDKDMKRERLGAAESVNAIKDRKIDAFFWVGGIPTAAVTDLAATPGMKMKLIDHSDTVEKMNAKYGKLYTASTIKAGAPPRTPPPPASPPRLPRRSVTLGGAAALGSLPLLSRRARAEPWPTRPVRFVVPFAAGGTTDILARVVAAKISEEFGQQFVVENKPGAGGNIAADFVAKAEADGYTFIVGTPGTHAISQFVFKNMTYDQINDIAPVIIIERQALAGVAGPADHRGGRRARLRGGFVVHHRRAGQDAEGHHRAAQRQRRQVSQNRRRHRAAAQARRRAGRRLARRHAALRAH